MDNLFVTLLSELLNQTGLMSITLGNIIMIIVGAILLYLGRAAPASMATVTRWGMTISRRPLGPFTLISFLSIFTSTPLGMGTGTLPMRLMVP